MFVIRFFGPWTQVRTHGSNTFWDQFKGRIFSVQPDQSFKLDSKYVLSSGFLLLDPGLVRTNGSDTFWDLLGAFLSLARKENALELVSKYVCS